MEGARHGEGRGWPRPGGWPGSSNLALAVERNPHSEITDPGLGEEEISGAPETSSLTRAPGSPGRGVRGILATSPTPVSSSPGVGTTAPPTLPGQSLELWDPCPAGCGSRGLGTRQPLGSVGVSRPGARSAGVSGFTLSHTCPCLLISSPYSAKAERRPREAEMASASRCPRPGRSPWGS